MKSEKRQVKIRFDILLVEADEKLFNDLLTETNRNRKNLMETLIKLLLKAYKNKDKTIDLKALGHVDGDEEK